MRVLYFGTYNPNYSRNRVLIKGLRLNNIEVTECRTDSGGIKKFIDLYRKHKKLRGEYDAMVIGFLGQQIVPFARLISRKPIIFDAFVSLYDSNVFDRKTVRNSSIGALYYRVLDWMSMRLADIVLFDTNEHIKYVSKEFNIPENKFKRIFVGTDDEIFYLSENSTNQVFTVFFHGHFIPLQGIDRIIEAAKLLDKEEIKFKILGKGQTYLEIRKLADKLGINNIDFIDNVSYEELPKYINKSDVCLGIFGGTPKAQRVIPNKVYEYAAMAKPIITMDTPAVRELFDSEDMILIDNNSRILANSILKLKKDKQRRRELGLKAYNKFKSFATVSILGKQLLEIINSQIKNH